MPSRTQRTRAPSPNGARLAPIGFAEGLDRSPGSWRRPRETGWRSGNHDDLPANLSSPVVLRVDIDVKTARLHELPEARTRRWRATHVGRIRPFIDRPGRDRRLGR